MVSAYKYLRAFLWQKQFQNEAIMKASLGVLRFVIRVIDELDTLEKQQRLAGEIAIADELKRFATAFELDANQSFEKLKEMETTSPRMMAMEAVR